MRFSPSSPPNFFSVRHCFYGAFFVGLIPLSLVWAFGSLCLGFLLNHWHRLWSGRIWFKASSFFDLPNLFVIRLLPSGVCKLQRFRRLSTYPVVAWCTTDELKKLRGRPKLASNVVALCLFVLLYVFLFVKFVWSFNWIYLC